MPTVSIIMTSYNKPNFIGKAIEGILKQSFTDFELLIMDDNSNDETQRAIAPYLKDKRIKFHRSNITNISQRIKKIRYAVLINEALEKVQGQYISYGTDDNVYRPERLKKMVQYLGVHPKVQIVFSASKTSYINGNGKVFKVIERPANSRTWVAPCIVDHCSVMHRRSILQVIKNNWGSYWDENPEFYLIGDARFFWRLNHFWPFYPLNEILDDNYLTETSLHQQYFSNQQNTLIRQLPKQRYCSELINSLMQRRRLKS